jgi:hypothetical protein
LIPNTAQFSNPDIAGHKSGFAAPWRAHYPSDGPRPGFIKLV